VFINKFEEDLIVIGDEEEGMKDEDEE